MKNHAKKYTRLCMILVIAGAMSQSSFAHLPSYEGERVRNDNHFTEEGFAWPVRGECDINAVGPTDVNAGSANIYLGPSNTPPNFFCAFTSQDDWSFEFPIDIIEATRTPAPDPSTLGQPLSRKLTFYFGKILVQYMPPYQTLYETHLLFWQDPVQYMAPYQTL